MFLNLRKHRLVIILIGAVLTVGVSVPAFMTASCLTRQQTPAEGRALESLRAMTRGGVLPAEDVVARIENDFPRTKAAALARLVRARIKIDQKDYAGAATLLDSSVIGSYSVLGDYALFMRATALEQAGRTAEARAAYDQVVADYASSLRAKHAALRSADILLRSGNTSAVPAALRTFAEADDGTALLLTARAYEQAGDSTRAIAAYRRLHFYAPASSESLEAARALPRLGSNLWPGSAEEAMARADKLFESRKFGEALPAYTDAFTRFPNVANPQAQLRKVIAATTARKMSEAVSALNTIPASAGEVRAEALYNVAQGHARAKQWADARTALDELRKSFASSQFAPRAFVAVGQIAEDANNDADATYFLRTAVNTYQSSIEVAQAQFDLAWMAHEDRNFAESSKLLTEHLAYYAHRNTDNRGRAGYWAARDSERAGKLDEARALYNAMQARYDANWYGYLAKQRLDVMMRSGVATVPAKIFTPDSVVGRAIANLK
ncbi:MAG TPA: tetratricopeptide repeat protein, partial [Pyrinomonadaceae bacterium]|nr:tetratricopeptide repeat protein [Pyrinomonadaceae bacterium]